MYFCMMFTDDLLGIDDRDLLNSKGVHMISRKQLVSPSSIGSRISLFIMYTIKKVMIMPIFLNIPPLYIFHKSSSSAYF